MMEDYIIYAIIMTLIAVGCFATAIKRYRRIKKRRDVKGGLDEHE